MHVKFAALSALSWLVSQATADCITSISQFRIKALWSVDNSDLNEISKASFGAITPPTDKYLGASSTNNYNGVGWANSVTEYTPSARYIWKIDECGYLFFGDSWGAGHSFIPYVDLGANYVEGTSPVPTSVEVSLNTLYYFQTYTESQRPTTVKRIRACVDPVTKNVTLDGGQGRTKIFAFQGKLILSSSDSPSLGFFPVRMYPTIYAA